MSDSDSDVASSVGDIIEETSEPDTTTFKCLFCEKEWNRVPEMFAHCQSEHKFNVESTIKDLGPGCDDLTIIKLVNYLRTETKKGTDPEKIDVTLEILADDIYLQPTFEDDSLLFEMGDFMPDFNEGDKPRDYDDYEKALKEKVPDDLDKIRLDDHRDTSYFESYKGAGIHREMIEDRVRTEGYRDFIEKNVDLFKGKTVLDVGCGTGILSLFCARAGAKKVFAVDNSDIAVRAKEIVKKNGYDDRVEVIQGKIEDFHTQRLIGTGKVDIIISEWMGYGLLFEGMLDSVLVARDLYLKRDGLMVPSHCTLRVAPVSDSEWISEQTGEKFWNDVYGFDFSPMLGGGLLGDKDIGVYDVPSKAICGSASTFYTIDIANVTLKELDFTAPFSTTLEKEIESLDAFAIWFDTFFMPPGSKQDLEAGDVLNWGKNGEQGWAFSTGPVGTPTHWHQAVLQLKKEDRVKGLRKGSTLKGNITYKKERGDVRGIVVDVTWEGEGADGPISGTLSRTMA
ncbi:histone-arginine methyltransferase CARM1 [Pleomassaria siparia CBS 279.74]|uniref:type I protein arginine methyltransferase n=1 Tax=Pleomassaria siparia CBS 279.74 TaxID=1314801 RepID=A0A6G1K1H3_9PLEO|nr:histone-arginine methyltransferase CARM1 [Pleomassaria siparia CBS 279.74]